MSVEPVRGTRRRASRAVESGRANRVSETSQRIGRFEPAERIGRASGARTMADGGRKRGRTSPLSAFFRWKTALRRVLVLFLLWAALSHQAGVVDDGVLHDPTARMAAFVGADFDYVIVFAVVTPPNPRLAESPQSLSAASAAAGPREPLAVEATQTSDGVSLPHELSDLRQKVQAVAETLAVRWPVTCGLSERNSATACPWATCPVCG